MTPFDWSWWRLAYSRTIRADQQEYAGWWRHIAFGLYAYRDKPTPGWLP